MAIKTILVPTDFSQASQAALRYAQELADTFGASLHMLHVLESPYLPGRYVEIYVPPPEEYVAQIEKETRERLERVLSLEEKEKYGARLVLKVGRPAEEILAYLSETTDINLVVMATHGRGAVARLMMGSVADKVVRGAPCPVLTLRPEAASFSGGTKRAA